MEDLYQEDVYPPVFAPMTKPRAYFVSSLRTTACDIMCTTNSALPETLSSLPPPPSEVPLMATLPYDKIGQLPMAGQRKGGTLFQKFRAGENIERKNVDLRREREDYMRKLFVDKKERDDKICKAAVMIQKIYRGFKVRPRSYSYVPRRKKKKVFTQNELHDVLCEMAGKLELKPIAGLNLESRVKASKRKQKIENAAAFIIQRFIRMIFQRSMALIVVKTRKLDQINKSARVITRAIRFLKTKNFVKRAEIVKKGRCVLKLQCAYRKWRAYLRVKAMRKLHTEMRIKNDAATIIQRNFSSKNRGELSFARATLLTIRSYKRMFRMAFDEVTSILADDIIDQELRDYIPKFRKMVDATTDTAAVAVSSELVEDAWMECCGEYIAQRLKEIEEERRKVEEERRQVEESLQMATEETHMRAHMADIEAQRRDAELAKERHMVYLLDRTIDIITDGFFECVVEQRVAEFALERYKEELLQEIEDKKRIELLRKKAFEDFVRDSAESFVQVALHKHLHGQQQEALEQMILDMANRIAEESINAAVSICSDTYSIYAKELASLNADMTVGPSTVASHPMDSSFFESTVEPEGGSLELDPVFPHPEFTNAVESQVQEHLEGVQQAGGEDLVDEASVSMASQQTSSSQPDDDSSSVAASERRQAVTNHVKDTAELFARARYQEAIGELNPVITELQGMMEHLRSTDVSTGKEIKFRILISVSRLLKARALQALGNYEASKLDLEMVLQDREASLGASNYLVAEVSLYMAEWYRGVGNYLEAEKYLQKADSIMMDDLASTEKDPDGTRMISSTFFKLLHRIKIAKCELLRNLGQYYKAQESLKQVQKSLSRYKALGLISFEVQEEFHVCYISSIVLRGKYANALTLHKELLEKRRAHYGPRHPKIASSMDAIGRLHLARSDIGEAAKYLEDSMIMRYELYPADHPAIAASHLSKAEAFMAMGRYEDAFVEATRSLHLFHQKFGPLNQYHPSLARALIILSRTHIYLGEPMLAIQAADDSLKIFKACWGVTELHRRTMDGLEALAEGYIAQKSYVQATDCLKQVITKRDTLHQLFGNKGGIPHELAMCQFLLAYVEVMTVPTPSTIVEQMKDYTKVISQVTGNRHVIIARCLYLLSEVCKLEGGHADAKSYVGFAYDMLVGLHGEEHSLVPLILAECADNLRIPGFFPEAMELCNNALHLAQNVLEMDQSTLLAQVLIVKGQILSDVKQFKEAEDTLLHAMNMVLAKAGEFSALYGIIVGHLAELYRRKRKIAVAERHFVSALQLGQAQCGLQSMAFLEMAMHYALLLMDMKQWYQAFEILHRDVEPQLLNTLGVGHIWTLFVQANAAICAQIDDLLNGNLVLPGLPTGGDASISEETILSQSLQHFSVQNFLVVWKQAGFGEQHPWYVRFQQLSSFLVAAESDLMSGNEDVPDGYSVGYSMASYVTSRRGTVVTNTQRTGAEDNSSWVSGTLDGDNDSLGSYEGSTVGSISRTGRSPRALVSGSDTSAAAVVPSSARETQTSSSSQTRSLLPTESSQYSASAALSTVLSVSKSLVSRSSAVPTNTSSVEGTSSSELPPREASVTSGSTPSARPPSLRSGLDRQPSYLSYHTSSYVHSARSSVTPRSLVSFAESQDRTASYTSPGEYESPRSAYTGKSGYFSMTPSTVRSRLHNLEDSRTTAQFESSVESSHTGGGAGEDGSLVSRGGGVDDDDNRSHYSDYSKGGRSRRSDSFTKYLNDDTRSRTGGDDRSYTPRSKHDEDDDNRSFDSYGSDSLASERGGGEGGGGGGYDSVGGPGDDSLASPEPRSRRGSQRESPRREESLSLSPSQSQSQSQQPEPSIVSDDPPPSVPSPREDLIR